MAMWTAEPRHDWPDGNYVGATCTVCGVTGFSHPKRAPRLCWPHYQESQRDAEWRRAKWEADMVAEFGPYTPRPDLFRREFPVPTTSAGDQDG
jgi:hypothetical protein